jgi:cytochrome P450
VRATEHGEKLTTEEILVNAILLLAAGQETATHLLGTAVLSLLRHPDQWERLMAEPELVESAVEECLRYESPFQFLTRTAAQDVEVAGVTIRAGQTVMLLLGSANRDARVFAEPDRLDVGRADNRHLAFGRGIHYCLGASLAKQEVLIALRALVRRLPTLRLTTDSVQWLKNFEFRGLASLPVAW